MKRVNAALRAKGLFAHLRCIGIMPGSEQQGGGFATASGHSLIDDSGRKDTERDRRQF